MIAQDVLLQQRELAPEPDALAAYAGKWVVVRDGEVLAAAIDPADLPASSTSAREVILHVPEDPAGIIV